MQSSRHTISISIAFLLCLAVGAVALRASISAKDVAVSSRSSDIAEAPVPPSTEQSNAALRNIQSIATASSASHPTWCDSVHLAYVDDDGLQVWTPTAGPRRVTSLRPLAGYAWSGDCNAISMAYRRSGELHAAVLNVNVSQLIDLAVTADITAGIVWENSRPIFIPTISESDARHSAAASNPRLAHADTAYIKDRDVFVRTGGASIRISEVQDRYLSAKLSPDRSRLLYYGSSVGLQLVNLSDGSRQRLPPYSRSEWFPDSRRILGAITTDDGYVVTSVRLDIYDITSAKVISVSTPTDYRGWQFALSPDGRTIAFVGDDGLYLGTLAIDND